MSVDSLATPPNRNLHKKYLMVPRSLPSKLVMDVQRERWQVNVREGKLVTVVTSKLSGAHMFNSTTEIRSILVAVLEVSCPKPFRNPLLGVKPFALWVNSGAKPRVIEDGAQFNHFLALIYIIILI